MRFGSVRAVAALALAFGILGSSNSGAVRPEAVGDGASLVTPVFTPLGVSKAPVTVRLPLPRVTLRRASPKRREGGSPAPRLTANPVPESGGGNCQTRRANHDQTEREDKPLVDDRADRGPFLRCYRGHPRHVGTGHLW